MIIVAASMHCYPEEVEFALRYKRAFPRSKIGFYGPFVGTNPEFFEVCSDFLISGELESSILSFIEGQHQFEGKLDYGIVDDLSKLPIPDWSLMDWKRFSYFPMLHQRPFFPMQATRGCSFNCDFCPYMVTQTKKFRMRPVEDVIAEMKFNHETYGMRSFLFRDICFTLHKKYATSIATRMIEENFNFEWGCETRLDCLNDELIDLLYQAGLRGVNLGIETGNNEILKDSGKKNPEIAQQEHTINYLQAKGIRVNAFYMLGLVEDTPETMQQTIDYAQHLNTLGAQFCINTPFPGTVMHDRVASDLMTQDYKLFNEYRPVINIPHSSAEEIQAAHSKSYQYYIRPAWLGQYGLKTAMRFIKNL